MVVSRFSTDWFLGTGRYASAAQGTLTVLILHFVDLLSFQFNSIPSHRTPCQCTIEQSPVTIKESDHTHIVWDLPGALFDGEVLSTDNTE